MSQSSKPEPEPLLSSTLEDFAVPGVVIVVPPAEAERLGAFDEAALSEADAWASNLDGTP